MRRRWWRGARQGARLGVVCGALAGALWLAPAGARAQQQEDPTLLMYQLLDACSAEEPPLFEEVDGEEEVRCAAQDPWLVQGLAERAIAAAGEGGALKARLLLGLIREHNGQAPGARTALTELRQRIAALEETGGQLEAFDAIAARVLARIEEREPGAGPGEEDTVVSGPTRPRRAPAGLGLVLGGLAPVGLGIGGLVQADFLVRQSDMDGVDYPHSGWRTAGGVLLGVGLGMEIAGALALGLGARRVEPGQTSGARGAVLGATPLWAPLPEGGCVLGVSGGF